MRNGTLPLSCQSSAWCHARICRSLRFEVTTNLGKDGEDCRRLKSLFTQIVPPRKGRLGCRRWPKPLGISSGNSGTPRRMNASQNKPLLGAATGRSKVQVAGGERTGCKMHLRRGRETKHQKDGRHGGSAWPGASWDWAPSEAQSTTRQPP